VNSSAYGTPLAATIEFRSTKPPSGSFVIENSGRIGVRVWRPGNSWGDSALSFRAKVDGQSVTITKVLQDYTRNVPGTVTVAPGGRYEYPFDLGDGTWQPASALTQLGQPSAELAGVYDSGDSPEAREQGVWQGELWSRRFRVRLGDH
jgi:hypothetical protein